MRDGRKNIPIGNDGTVHECEEFVKAKKSTRRIDRSGLSPEDIARYEEKMNQATKD